MRDEGDAFDVRDGVRRGLHRRRRHPAQRLDQEAPGCRVAAPMTLGTFLRASALRMSASFTGCSGRSSSAPGLPATGPVQGRLIIHVDSFVGEPSRTNRAANCEIPSRSATVATSSTPASLTAPPASELSAATPSTDELRLHRQARLPHGTPRARAAAKSSRSAGVRASRTPSAASRASATSRLPASAALTPPARACCADSAFWNPPVGTASPLCRILRATEAEGRRPGGRSAATRFATNESPMAPASASVGRGVRRDPLRRPREVVQGSQAVRRGRRRNSSAA